VALEKTIVKCLRLVEALGRGERLRGISDLARELELNRSNIHRLLNTLVETGYVRRHAEGRYELTLKLWEIGVAVLGKLDLREASREHMQWLADQTGETVHLSILDGGEVVYIDKIESQQPVRAYSEVGGRAPAYCVATGKSLLSALDDEGVMNCCPTLVAFTPHTITSHEDLMQELGTIRARGYALNKGEWRAEVCGAGALARDHRGNPVVAIGISGPAERLKLRRLAGLAENEVMEAAHRISVGLGYSAGARDPSRNAAHAAKAPRKS
jgi:DNA-binding IclR family transcriptional regulator